MIKKKNSMNVQNSKRYIEEDEIDLRELFKTIWDKKVSSLYLQR